MLIRASAIPAIEMIKAAEAVDAEAAALWLHMGLWDTLGEMIDDARPEMDAVWKSLVAERSDEARRLLVRQAVERRIDGGEIDDVVKAAAGLSLVRGYVAKAESADQRRKATEHEPRDPGTGRWARASEMQGTPPRTGVERGSYDALAGLTQRNEGLKTNAEGVAEQLTGTNYDRMRVVGNALVATGHPKAMAAGGAVRVAAEVGPSAEDVLGTHLRRVAYRYRGTEKRPDRQLVRETKEAQAYVGGMSATPSNEAEQHYQRRLTEQLEARKPGEWGKGSVAYRLAQADRPGTHLTEDQLEMRATGDVAAAYLMRQLPSKDEALLSQEAGRTPPSVGVLIDRDGDVVSEAMGYQGDHYVPFDLKNLKRLQGGSYVRTRALGGPTSEDIYTGLLAGARQVQVVSRSGVFTIEFDPDLRGGRRYSDKARQMVDRYSRLLDVVERGTTMPTERNPKGEPIYTQDIDEDVKRDLWRKAMHDADYDEDEAKVRFNRAIKQKRAEASLGYTEEDLDAQVDTQLRAWIRNRTEAGHAPGRQEVGRAREQIRDEVRDSARTQREQNSVQRLRLNAEGYFRAMQSLRREFPYYVRDVSYESLPDFEEHRRTRQMGEAPLGFGAPGAASTRTHVRRRNLVPEEQATAYGVKQRPGRTKAAPATEGGGEGGGGEGGKPKTGGGEEVTASFGETLKNEKFQDEVASQARVLRLANEISADGNPVVLDLKAPRDGQMDREWAMSLGNDQDYVKWLVTRSNTVTHGDLDQVGKFITQDATAEELKRIASGLREMGATKSYTGDFSPEKIESFAKLVTAIGKARKPYGDAKGEPALYQPEKEIPRPYPFPEIAGKAMVTPEKFDKVRRQLETDENLGGKAMEEAFSWAESHSDSSCAAELRRSVQEFNAGVRWGQERAKARKDGEEPPVKPDDLRGVDISAADADEMAAEPKKSPLYKELERRQRAWAWKYTERLRTELGGVMGGGEGPKVEPLAIEGTKSARLDTSSRRLVWHQPHDPLSQALAKRLRPRRSGRIVPLA